MNDCKRPCIPSFYASSIGEPRPRYIAWIDIMGTKSIMSSSLYRAAIFIGKLHDAIISSQREVKGISLHPIVDGAYAISEELKPLLGFVQKVMMRMFAIFCNPEKDGELEACDGTKQLWRKQALVRAAIAYSPIYMPQQMSKGFHWTREYDFSDAYFSNVLVGNLLGEASHSEGKAPPFGIYLCPSVICQNEILPKEQQARHILGRNLYRWFMDASLSEERSSLGLPPTPSAMGEKILAFLEAEKKNAIESQYPEEKHEKWLQMVKEYFCVEEKKAHN